MIFEYHGDTTQQSDRGRTQNSHTSVRTVSGEEEESSDFTPRHLSVYLSNPSKKKKTERIDQMLEVIKKKTPLCLPACGRQVHP
jgi:hypothetical protein